MKDYVLQTITALEAKQEAFESLSNTARRPEARDCYSRKAISIQGLIIDLKGAFKERETFGTVDALPDFEVGKSS